MKKFGIAIFIIFFAFAPFAFSQNNAIVEVFTQKELDREPWYYSVEEAFLDIDKVYKLDLSNKKLKTFPMEVLAFKNLQVLWLNGNKIDSIPKAIKRLSKLQELNLAHNRITRLPDEIGDLTELKKLQVNTNQLHKFPLGMHGLQKLRFLDLTYNNFTTHEIEWIDKILAKCDIRY